MKWDVVNQSGKVVGSVDLDDGIFSGKPHRSVLAESIKIYRGNKRQGSADTKERGEIAKSTAKPWRQKGTGSARAGRASSPIWRGGGVVFGPTPRSYRRTLPRKVKRLACQSALRVIVQDKSLRILEALEIKEVSSKNFSQLLANIEVASNALVVVRKIEGNLYHSAKNLKKIKLKEVKDINALHLLELKHVVFTKEAILDLTDRLKAPIHRMHAKTPQS